MTGADESLPDRLTDRARNAVAFLRRLDLRNLRMLTKTLFILARPAVRDWQYNHRLALQELPQAVWNLATNPGGMNDFQSQCSVAGYVSTPEDGILAGFTDRGRMSTLLYPHTGFTQQLPYLESGEGFLDGARPRDGGFFGVEVDDETVWLWESQFGHSMHGETGTGLLTIHYEPVDDAPVAATEVVYVQPGTETVVRDVTVENVGDHPVDGITYYMQANANARQQYPPGITSPNSVWATGRTIQWADRASEVGIRLSVGPADTVVDAGVTERGLADVGGGANSASGTHIGGYLTLDCSLAPGERATRSVFVSGIGDGEATPPAETPVERQTTTENYWDERLADAPVDAVPERFRAQYQRSLVAILGLADPKSGSLSAAPNLQPAYYPSWPRDGAIVAIALAEAGAGDVAKRYLADFLGSVQEPDGGFEQCYTSDGEPAGVIHRENDQQGIYLHAVRRVYEETGDADFLERVWPTVRGAAEYTLGAVADNGLLEATPDFAEMPDDARQSLWTNAYAYRGLLDAADLAAELRRDSDAGRYRQAAGAIGDAIDRHLFPPGEPFATHLALGGRERDENVAFSAAVHPTGWAGAYGHTDDLVDAFVESYERYDRYWLPKEFTLAATLYAVGRASLGDELLAELQAETLPGGTLAEEVDADGEHRFAALGWANAGFVHAIHVREGIARNGHESPTRLVR